MSSGTLERARVIPSSVALPPVESPHYNERYSGSSLTAKGHPLYNPYSKWIHERSRGAYGFSLDDEEGLKGCQSPTLIAVGCPVCVPDASGSNCELPAKSLPDPVPKAELKPANDQIVDPTRQPDKYTPPESYLQPSWLTLSRFDATRGSIDTDFSAFPDNKHYVGIERPSREDPFHVAFNVANQSGLENSTCRMKTSLWVTIDAGSPNLILAYQKIEPGEGYQFLIDMNDEGLRDLLAQTPKLPSPHLSGPLVGGNGKDRCAPECTDKPSAPRHQLEVDCQDITSRASECVADDDAPTGYGYCKCPKTGDHCDPNFTIRDGLCYSLRDPNAKGFAPPCSPCWVALPPMCEDKADPNTPACCFGESYSAPRFQEAKACTEGNYWDWQLGGGRISLSYVDPATQEGVPPEYRRIQPKLADKRWNAQVPQTGAKMAAIEQDNYAALLEFTVDYFMNVPGPQGYAGPTVFYDISTVDSVNLPVYMKAAGKNENPRDKCVSNSGQCCFTFVGSPQHYLDAEGGTLKQACPTDIFANKREDTVVPWWGKCMSAYNYCTDRAIGASGKKPADSDVCRVWDNFAGESPPFAKYRQVTPRTPPLDDPLADQLSSACGAIWQEKGLIPDLSAAKHFAKSTDLWALDACRSEYVAGDKTCCEPKMQDYVNNVIWGCESASNPSSPDQIKINDAKCRAMNWGVFPNYSSGSAATSQYQRPAALLSPEAFECDMVACGVSYASKPYVDPQQSMTCTGPMDTPPCCGHGVSPECWGVQAPRVGVPSLR